MTSQFKAKDKSVLSEYYKIIFAEKYLEDFLSKIHLYDFLRYNQEDIKLDGNIFVRSAISKLFRRVKDSTKKETCILTYAGQVVILILNPQTSLLEIFTSLKNERRWLVILDKYYLGKLNREMDQLRSAIIQ